MFLSLAHRVLVKLFVPAAEIAIAPKCRAERIIGGRETDSGWPGSLNRWRAQLRAPTYDHGSGGDCGGRGYTRRWPAQENAIRDWLIPLGIDTNHGYAKTVVANSEVTKKREALQKRLENVQRWTDGARKRMHNASKLYRKRCQQTKERADMLYRVLNEHQMEMEQQGVEHWLRHKTIKEEKAGADAEIEEYQQRQWKAYHTSNKEFAKCEKYCREQRELLRALEDLERQEREMYELDVRPVQSKLAA
ncbi:hypothetical protein [Ktedonobacter racemifer]|uniref:Uncharacterized protein n=1 Tax=Ktedonobacter racemifer DSM 44963 TaxID=485913 RepID=D6U6M2_KTERA|nr:hypothetical protein [Ktedonobacter racemifer]EFH80633.1 hypothetical protein Krac_1248 [Ktedonobacter racemifer DSM 44963]